MSCYPVEIDTNHYVPANRLISVKPNEDGDTIVVYDTGNKPIIYQSSFGVIKIVRNWKRMDD